jgi:hypothetical protein
MNLKEIRIDVNPLLKKINFIHIPSIASLCEVDFEADIDWSKLVLVAGKNINTIAIRGDFIQMLFGNGKITIVNLENEEVIGEGEAKIAINWVKIASLLIQGKL